MKPQSLEGCSVVLQDQRLNLIAGDLAKSSEAIHDILGLSLLSKMMPIIKEKIKKLTDLVEKQQELDPVKKWEIRHKEFNENRIIKETHAIQAGYPAIFQNELFGGYF